MKCHRGVILCTTAATLLLAAVYLHNHSGTLCPTCDRTNLPSSPYAYTMYTQLLSPHPSQQESQIKGAPIDEPVIVSHLNTLHLNSSKHFVALGKNSFEPSLSEMIRAPLHCVQMNCREHLSISEQNAMRTCERDVRRVEHIMTPIKNGDCRFLPEMGRVPVALPSSGGSGNTWTRGLLEKATGICTGFVMCDAVMRSCGYVGESIKSGKVLVVKTHSLMPKWKGANNSRANLNDACYGSAVFILRSPFNAAIADWNRRSAQNILGKHNSSIAKDRHTYSVPQELFRKLYNIPGGG